ncbi:hypothetical protein [Nocardiopsis chromatogenes]|uniref:hypothetical protein n=1 Tax=Nocardiopsis chromatogenes TaxID=280239 RepID=UPI00034A53B1|nr:hypothetical protein [Nocardiopsis chromatogenes]
MFLISPVVAVLLAVVGLALLGKIAPHRRGMAVTGLVLLIVYALWTPLYIFVLQEMFLFSSLTMVMVGSVLDAVVGYGLWGVGLLLLVLAATRGAPARRATAAPAPPGPPGPPPGSHPYGPPAGYGPPPDGGAPPPPPGPPPAGPHPPAAS